MIVIIFILQLCLFFWYMFILTYLQTYLFLHSLYS